MPKESNELPIEKVFSVAKEMRRPTKLQTLSQEEAFNIMRLKLKLSSGEIFFQLNKWLQERGFAMRFTQYIIENIDPNTHSAGFDLVDSTGRLWRSVMNNYTHNMTNTTVDHCNFTFYAKDLDAHDPLKDWKILVSIRHTERGDIINAKMEYKNNK